MPKNIKNNSKLSNNPHDSIGVIHNHGLDFHYCFTDTINPDSLVVYDSLGNIYVKKTYFDGIMNDFMSFAVDDLLWETTKAEESVIEAISIFEDAGIFTSIDGIEVVKNINNHQNDIIRAALNRGLISNAEFDKLLPIGDALENKNYNLVETLFDNIDLSNFNSETQQRIFWAKSVYENSGLYWSYWMGYNPYLKSSNDNKLFYVDGCKKCAKAKQKKMEERAKEINEQHETAQEAIAVMGADGVGALGGPAGAIGASGIVLIFSIFN